ncbi:hypothetical protein XENOCAPTIV_030420 [Xenoophorus captivus]|uniref:Peptidase aspartic putative domain-containing protein n=1 Tax=Xenoophorus captivus TaxID=1517983 RepID=A0ABV0RP56_9TELE
MQLRDFAGQLRGCKDMLAAMKCEEELSGHRTLVEIISKLPSDLRAKWLNKNYDIAREGCLPKLDDVVCFVETEAEKRSDPVFGGLISYKKQENPNNFTSPTKHSKNHLGRSQEGISTRSVDLENDSLHDDRIYTSNGVRTLKKLNIGLSCLVTPDKAARWDHLADVPIPSIKSNDIHLVIGQDAPRLLRAEEYRVGGDNDPYATRTVLGWAINETIGYKEVSKAKAYFLKSDQCLQTQVERFGNLMTPFKRTICQSMTTR